MSLRWHKKLLNPKKNAAPVFRIGAATIFIPFLYFSSLYSFQFFLFFSFEDRGKNLSSFERFRKLRKLGIFRILFYFIFTNPSHARLNIANRIYQGAFAHFHLKMERFTPVLKSLNWKNASRHRVQSIILFHMRIFTIMTLKIYLEI